VDEPPKYVYLAQHNAEYAVKGYVMQDMVDHGYLTVKNPAKKKLEDWLALLNKNNNKQLNVGQKMDYYDQLLEMKDSRHQSRQVQNKWHALLWKYLFTEMSERKLIKPSVKMGKKIESSSDLKKQLQSQFKSKNPLKALDTKDEKDLEPNSKVDDALDGWITSELVRIGVLGA